MFLLATNTGICVLQAVLDFPGKYSVQIYSDL